jgi:hypothetical protein
MYDNKGHFKSWSPAYGPSFTQATEHPYDMNIILCMARPNCQLASLVLQDLWPSRALACFTYLYQPSILFLG